MIFRNLLLSLFGVAYILFGPSPAKGQSVPILTCTVSSGSIERNNSPVSVSLQDLDYRLDSHYLMLWEWLDTGRKQVRFQIDNEQLYWMMDGITPPGQKRVYQLMFSKESLSKKNQDISVIRIGGVVKMMSGNKSILNYQLEEVDPPEGESPLFRRGGYIHPLWTPNGEVLTRIQPPDHIHHYGIWNPWTKTHFEGREIDFWNLNKGQGTVRPEGSAKRISGPIFGEVIANHDHVDLNGIDPSGAKTALHEQWRIRAWNADPDQAIWLIDFESRLDCATDSVFKIDAYRYQGFGFRATGKWNDQTARLLTSEGKNKSDGNATRARWCDINGISDSGTSGILFMTHRANYNFPEQLRIWPTGTNEGKENVFFNFNPAQEEDWILEPGKAHYLRYRMVVYDGALNSDQAERYWQDYVHPPKVEINVIRNAGPDRVLVYTKNGKGYVHDNLKASVDAIRKLGAENGFAVDASEDSNYITEENLKKYTAIILSNTNNETFDTPAQKLAFQRYIQAGGGLVGIHVATGSERAWPWFWKVMGGKFRRHPPLQDFQIKIVDHSHASVMHLNDVWSWEDECYYIHYLNPGMHVIMAADLTSVEDDKKDDYPGTVFGNYVPLSWYQELYEGRQWYTALGHKIEYYSDPEFTQHILGGILWTLEGRTLNYANATDTLQMD